MYACCKELTSITQFDYRADVKVSHRSRSCPDRGWSQTQPECARQCYELHKAWFSMPRTLHLLFWILLVHHVTASLALQLQSRSRTGHCPPSSLLVNSIDQQQIRFSQLVSLSTPFRPGPHSYAGYDGPWLENQFFQHWQDLKPRLPRLYLPIAWTDCLHAIFNGGARWNKIP